MNSFSGERRSFPIDFETTGTSTIEFEPNGRQRKVRYPDDRDDFFDKAVAMRLKEFDSAADAVKNIRPCDDGTTDSFISLRWSSIGNSRLRLRGNRHPAIEKEYDVRTLLGIGFTCSLFLESFRFDVPWRAISRSPLRLGPISSSHLRCCLYDEVQN